MTLLPCSQLQYKNTTIMQGGIVITWEGERWKSIHSHTILIKVCCSNYSVLLLVCALSGFSRIGLIEWIYITNEDLSGWLLWYTLCTMAICRLRGWEPSGCSAYKAEGDSKLMLKAWKSPVESQVFSLCWKVMGSQFRCQWRIAAAVLQQVGALISKKQRQMLHAIWVFCSPFF